jgi:hypothetical protein
LKRRRFLTTNTFASALASQWEGDGRIVLFDAAGNVTETHEQAGDFKEW